jgi:hypothetical protein
VLSREVVSHHSTPDIGSRCLWTPKHLSNPSVLPHLYTMPDLYLCLSFSNRGEQQMRSALDDQHKGFRRHTGLGVHHAKPVTTRLPKLDLSGELACLVGLRG